MNRYLLFVLLALSTPATFASLATLTGGNLTAYATAGGYDGGRVDTDKPSPITPGMGLTRLSAFASSTESGVNPVNGSALARANIIDNPNGGMTFQLNSNSLAKLAHLGPGWHAGAYASSSVTVAFTLLNETAATLYWSSDTFLGRSSVTVIKDGEPFDISSGVWNWARYLFGPGQYEISLFTEQGQTDMAVPTTASASMTLILGAPVMGSIWLFGPALAGVVAMGRRIDNQPRQEYEGVSQCQTNCFPT
ncbi:MAG: hypothetical protein FIA97_09775 [Methylococcaceae bacterium]|nr:hypothetical protein [Methylococcaceae bacterium]